MKTLLLNVISLGAFFIFIINQGMFETGAERLAKDPGTYLQGKRIGIVCHHASVVRKHGNLAFLPDVLNSWIMLQTDGTKLAALFSPEHGIDGSYQDGALVPHRQESKWGCPVYSLHGKNKKPTPEMLQNIDMLVIDLQEVGVRCYTYLSTLQLVLEAAASSRIPVLLLGRPNPIIFWEADGPIREAAYESFVAKMPIPFLHGETITALAQKINQQIKANLTVLDYQGDWRAQKSYFKHYFVPPSPNLARIQSVYAYPISVFLEGTNYSEGRGTKTPFEIFGAPWVDAAQLVEYLNAYEFPGITFEEVHFTPHKIPGVADNPKHVDTMCHGAKIVMRKKEVVMPLAVSFALLKTLFFLYPQQSQWLKSGERYIVDSLMGTDSWRKQVMLQALRKGSIAKLSNDIADQAPAE